MSYTNPIKYTVRITQPSYSFVDLHQQTKLPAFFNKSEVLAALACAEVLRHSKLDPQFLENLLTQALHDNSLYDEWFIEKTESIQYLTNLLPPELKKTLHHFYTHSKSNDAEFDDIVRISQQECDYVFLQHVTKIITKAYLREIKHCNINTSN